MKTAEVHLSLFKQGDDLGHHLQESKSIPEALERYALQLESVVQHLRSLKDAIKGHEVEMEADTHYISITGSDKLIDTLLEKDLVSENPFGDELEEELEDEEEEEEEDDR